MITLDVPKSEILLKKIFIGDVLVNKNGTWSALEYSVNTLRSYGQNRERINKEYDGSVGYYLLGLQIMEEQKQGNKVGLVINIDEEKAKIQVIE